MRYRQKNISEIKTKIKPINDVINVKISKCSKL